MPDAQGVTSFIGSFMKGYMGGVQQAQAQKMANVKYLTDIAQNYQKTAENPDISEKARSYAAQQYTKFTLDADKEFNRKIGPWSSIAQLFGWGKKNKDGSMGSIPLEYFKPGEVEGPPAPPSAAEEASALMTKITGADRPYGERVNNYWQNVLNAQGQASDAMYRSELYRMMYPTYPGEIPLRDPMTGKIPGEEPLGPRALSAYPQEMQNGAWRNPPPAPPAEFTPEPTVVAPGPVAPAAPGITSLMPPPSFDPERDLPPDMNQIMRNRILNQYYQNQITAAQDLNKSMMQNQMTRQNTLATEADKDAMDLADRQRKYQLYLNSDAGRSASQEERMRVYNELVLDIKPYDPSLQVGTREYRNAAGDTVHETFNLRNPKQIIDSYVKPPTAGELTREQKVQQYITAGYAKTKEEAERLLDQDEIKGRRALLGGREQNTENAGIREQILQEQLKALKAKVSAGATPGAAATAGFSDAEYKSALDYGRMMLSSFLSKNLEMAFSMTPEDQNNWVLEQAQAYLRNKKTLKSPPSTEDKAKELRDKLLPAGRGAAPAAQTGKPVNY